MVVIRKRSKLPVIQTSCVTSRTNGSNEKQSYKEEEQKTKTRFQMNMFSWMAPITVFLFLDYQVWLVLIRILNYHFVSRFYKIHHDGIEILKGLKDIYIYSFEIYLAVTRRGNMHMNAFVVPILVYVSGCKYLRSQGWKNKTVNDMLS